MNETEKTTFSVPIPGELEQLTELHKAMGDYTLVSDAERFLRQRIGTKDGGHRIGHIPPASCASDCPVSAITQGREKRDLFLAG